MADMKIRDYLTGRGVNDSDITYNNGNVMLKGKQFYGATPQADGSTYGDQNKLNQAFNSYNMNDALDTFKSNLAKPSTPFTYDAQSDPMYQNALQAAQRGAQTAGNNATVALGARGIGNSQQALTTQNQIGQRAVADVNSNVLPQLMNQAYSRYHDQQLMDQQKNNDYLNLAGTLNGFNQQGIDNQYRDNVFAENQKQGRIDLAKWGQGLYGYGDPKADTQTFFDQYQGAKTLPQQQFDYGKTQDQIQNDRADKQLNATLSNMTADNARANAAQSLANGDKDMATRFKIWEATGVAPAGIPGVSAGTTLKDSDPNSLDNRYKQAQIDSLNGKSSSAKISDKESTDNYNTILGDIGGKGVTKEQAMKLVQANRDYLSDSDYKKAMDYIQKEF